MESTAATSSPRLALTIEQTCEALTISRPTFYELVAAGRLRTIKVGRRRIVPITEVERLLADDGS